MPPTTTTIHPTQIPSRFLTMAIFKPGIRMSSIILSISPSTATATPMRISTATQAVQESHRPSLMSLSRRNLKSTANRRSMHARRDTRTWVRNRCIYLSKCVLRAFLDNRLRRRAIHSPCSKVARLYKPEAQHAQALFRPLPIGTTDRRQETWCWRAEVPHSMCVCIFPTCGLELIHERSLVTVRSHAWSPHL